MVITEEQVNELAAKLGYDEEATAVVVRRAGSLATAHQRLRAKLASQERFVNAQHERRLADQRADRARSRHHRRQAEARDERRVKREKMKLSDRLAACLEMAALMPGVSAAGIAGGGSAPGKKESKVPPASRNELADFYLPRVAALIGNFERELDAEAHGSDATAETPEARDLRVVHDYEGFEAHEVATFDHSVGSAQVVERARRKHGRSAARGYRRPEVVA